MTTLVWFRQDLRLADNPALAAALDDPGGVVPMYLFSPNEEGAWPPGAAARWWLHQSLQRLGEQLQRHGSRLCLGVAENSLTELLRLAQVCGAQRVMWNRRYEPAAIARDRVIKAQLRAAGLQAESHNSALLYEPWSIETKGGRPFQAFTPFWRRCQSLPDPPAPLPAPTSIPGPKVWPDSQSLDSLALLPRIDWAAGLRAAWSPGSDGAQVRLESFLHGAFAHYAQLRNPPAEAGTSRLSPHLHFGEIGPRQIWHATRQFAATLHNATDGAATSWRDSPFLTELGWREFAHHLLFHFPEIPQQPLRANLAHFPWRQDEPALRRWQHGLTGYPIVDAGLRELWHTGWMHNRVRMIAASFLVKDLLIPWQQGAGWFWDTLVDADLASNTLGWQWVAGCGADAAPFFRIFNPLLQGTKFDPDGRYIRRWVPELALLPNEWIHRPAHAPATVLQRAGVILGTTYPNPVVNHDQARTRALQALALRKTS